MALVPDLFDPFMAGEWQLMTEEEYEQLIDLTTEQPVPMRIDLRLSSACRQRLSALEGSRGQSLLCRIAACIILKHLHTPQ